MVQIKKGQIEILGLLVIVVLIVVVALLFLSLSFNKNSDNEISKLSTLKANNMMNALDKVSLVSGSGGELIKECCESSSKCDELKSLFDGIPIDLGESVGLFVSDNYIGGSCREGVSSSSFTYGVECSARVVICES